MSADLEKEYLAWQSRRLKAARSRFLRCNPQHPAFFDMLYVYNWLQREIHPSFQAATLQASGFDPYKEPHSIILNAADEGVFLSELLSHRLANPDDEYRCREDLRELMALYDHQLPEAVDDILATWQKLGIFRHMHIESVRRIQAMQKLTAEEVGGDEDQKRVALVDALGESGGEHAEFSKIGLIPHMACAKNCRHCMFVWRNPMKDPPDPAPLLERVNSSTTNLLFTGGDLDKRMDELYRAIAEMEAIEVFAILLNGAFATSPAAADGRFQEIRTALEQRPAHFKPARVTLQISFDEYHQEIISDKDGNLSERIPVANIANLVAASVGYPEIQFVLLHKQNRLNFSENLFKVGVFARLSRALPRPKADPINPAQKGGVIRDVLFTLAGHPERPIHMMSSTIDAYGRAALLDPSEYINERDYLKRILKEGPPAEERFDTDPMVWYDGSVTLFSAAHLWMGNLFTEGDRVFARWRNDPLLAAVERFDPILLEFYSQAANDLKELKKRATGPHHLFHQLTESAPMRLHLTRSLVDSL